MIVTCDTNQYKHTLNQVVDSCHRTSYTLAGQLIALDEDGVIRYTHNDHLGSPAILMQKEGDIVLNSTIARYKPYGGYLTQPSATALDRGYTGHDRTAADDSLGLVYMNARYLDSSTGRFISPDTIIPDPDSPQAFNRYSYVLGNPINHTDPSGHCVFGIDTLVCIAIGAGILKAIDYGWSAWDLWQAGRTLSDPNATRDAKAMAALTVALTVVFEAIEPDELLPVALPVDDLARRTFMSGAQEAFDNGGREALDQFVRNELGNSADNVLSKIDEVLGVTVPTNRRALRTAMGTPPVDMMNAQAHHNLPWKFREWFAAPGRGLDVNDFGRWVEGTPPGSHQNWTRAYNDAWEAWIGENPNASRQQVFDFLNQLLESGRYP